MPIFRLVKNLSVSARENSSAYGYSITVTGSFALLSAAAPHRPQAPDLFLAAAGAGAAFVLIELLALILGRFFPEGDDSQQTRLLARLLSIVSIAGGMAAAYVCGLYLRGPLAWFLGTFSATFVFVLLESAELAAVDAGRQDS